MADEQVVKQLVDRLSTEDLTGQELAAEQIRDLVQGNEQYCIAFAQHGAIEPLVGLLDADSKELSLTIAQSVACMVQHASVHTEVRDAGTISSVITVLQPGQEPSPAMLQAVLQILLGLAQDDTSRLAVQQGNGLPRIIKLLEYATGDDADKVQQAAAALLGLLAQSEANKGAIRNSHGVAALLRVLERPKYPRAQKEVVIRALTIVTEGHELNQDYVREQYGIPRLVKLLEAMPFDTVTAASADALRALASGNEANKTAIREAWAVPLLVKLLGNEVDQSVTEKAVDCLRILTTGNEANKVALLTSASGLPCLVRLMEQSPDQTTVERAAAVVGNLSTTDQFFSAIREAGAIQKLVKLLDHGPTSRTTEIAAKTLANLASESSNRKGIRLAGGVPPLMRLLMDRPSEQVMVAVDEAMRRLQIENIERNAILDAFRYSDARNAAAQTAVQEQQQQQQAAAPLQVPEQSQQEAAAQSSKPFTRFTVQETVQLLADLGLRDGSAFETNGITGGDLLELDNSELREDLGLTNLQVKKVNRLQDAFGLFNRMMQTPGKAELTLTELRDFLIRSGRSNTEAASVVTGLKQATQKNLLAALTFPQFVQCYQWLLKTLHLMQEVQQPYELPRSSSMRLPSTNSSQDASPLKAAPNGI